MILSATSYNTYKECPLKFKYTYIYKLFQPQSNALEIGSAYHLMLELHSNGISDQVAVERAFEITSKCIIENPKTDKELKNNYLSSKDGLRAMLDKYKENPVVGNIISREQFFRLTEKDIGVDITGKIDREDDDKTIDYKTTSKDYKEENCKDVQSRLYTFYRWHRDGKIFPFVYSVLNKDKINNPKYKPQKITINYTEDEIKFIPREFKEVNDKIINKEFAPIIGACCYMCQWGRKSGCNVCKHSL